MGFSKLAAVVMGLALATGPGAAGAEVGTLRISRGHGILFLPLMVMEQQRLVEKHARAAGLGEVAVSWPMFDGGNIINDAMLSGALDIAGIGAPGFITLWAKARAIAKLEVVGVAGLSATSLYLNTNNPRVKTLRDFTPEDKIAMPGIKTSLSAVVLQMAVAREFGLENYARLDPLTVGLPHPDAMMAVVSGKTGISSHLGSPPYSYLELETPGVHRVMNSVDVLGNITLDVVYTTEAVRRGQPEADRRLPGGAGGGRRLHRPGPRRGRGALREGLQGEGDGRGGDADAGRSRHPLHHHAGRRDGLRRLHAQGGHHQGEAGRLDRPVPAGPPREAGDLTAAVRASSSSRTPARR